MVPCGRTIRLPLLPYERQLIDLLGISREEYEWFAEQTWHRARLRPEGYEHIPDVRAEVTAIIVSLAIGLASSAASYLLAPKPKAEAAARDSGGRSVELADVAGQERFAPTFGFDSQQSLANYGAPIPLIFTNSGLLISPQLVWSRVLSRGRYQIAEMQFLVGQGPLPIRDDWAAAGGKYGNLFLGNNTLDTSSVEDFAFYYRDGSGTDNRFGREHLKAGSLRAEVPLAFTAPLGEGYGDETFGFSSTFTPANQTQFGVYNGIPNGTALRLNWQVVSHNRKGEDESPLDIRNWISGPWPDDAQMKNAGMTGTGASFARRTGVIGTSSSDVVQTFRDAKADYIKARIYRGDVGTTITIDIGVGRQSEKFGSIQWERKVNAANQGKDLQNILEGEHASHDDALQIGEQFMIGTGLWQVTKRENPDLPAGTASAFWRTEIVGGETVSRTLRVTLRCIKRLSGFAKSGGIEPITFGVVDREVIATTLPPYIGATDNEGRPVIHAETPDASESFVKKDYLIDEAFFPICKAALGVVQNTRPCDVTEIGIKSQVWLRFNNLCNFATIPSPSELSAADREGTQFQTGYMSKYADRVSLFSLDIRPAGAAADVEWAPSGETFAIVGNTPVDVFNYIRIIHPKRAAYEYRLRPRTSAEAVYLIGGDWEVIELDASRDSLLEWEKPVLGSAFKFRTNGRRVTVKELWASREMGAATVSVVRRTLDKVAEVSVDRYQYRAGLPGTPTLQQVSDGWRFMLAYRLASPDGAGAPVMSGSPGPLNIDTAPGSALYAKHDPTVLPEGYSVAVEEAFRPTATNFVRFRFNLRVVRHSDGVQRWELSSTEVVDSGTGYSVGSLVSKGLILGYEGDTTTARTPALEIVYKVTRLAEEATTETTPVTRVFGKYTAIAEVSQYPNQIQRSCDNGPEHEVSYVNESLRDAAPATYPRCAMVGLRLRSGRSFSRLDQFRIFAQRGLQVPLLRAGTTEIPLGSTSLFSDVANYLLSSTETGAGQLAGGLVDQEQMRRCSKFLINNNLFFNDAITDPINIRSFLGEVAPSMLCALVIRNGVFSVEPALPFNPDSGAIETTKPVKIAAMFTSGNIIEDSFSAEYLAAEERKDFTAVVRWREHNDNEFPQSRAYEAHYTDVPEERRPIEEFDLRWVGNEEHAQLAARYFLAIRRRVTHTVKFRTTPLGSTLLPGSYILVSTNATPYTPLSNGIILADGTIISTTPLSEGTVSIYYWVRGRDTVDETNMVVEKDPTTGVLSTKAPRDAIFSIKPAGAQSNCYMVESITLDQDGMVEVSASHFPLDAEGFSLIVKDVAATGGTPTIAGRSL